MPLIQIVALYGRPEQHEIARAVGGKDRGRLRGIGGQGQEKIGGRDNSVELTLVGQRALRARVGLLRRLDQVAHDRVALEQFRSVDEVFPHEVLGEREGR